MTTLTTNRSMTDASPCANRLQRGSDDERCSGAALARRVASEISATPLQCPIHFRTWLVHRFRQGAGKNSVTGISPSDTACSTAMPEALPQLADTRRRFGDENVTALNRAILVPKSP